MFAADDRFWPKMTLRLWFEMKKGRQLKQIEVTN